MLLEEYGHFVDAQINPVDSAGDEGAIFAELVQGDALSDSQLALLRAENDWVTVMIDGQLMAIEQSNPTPTLIASYQGLRSAWDVRVVGNYAYLADLSTTTADLKIFNISTPAAPVLVSQSDATNVISDVDFSNGYVYAADGTSGLRVIDVTNPSSPNLKSTYNSPGDAQDVKIVGNYAYVADGTSGLQIVNIRNPNSPVLQGTAGISIGVIGSVSSVDVVDNYAYIVNKVGVTGRMQIINISNPASPTKSGEYSFVLEGFVSNVQVLGNYAYISAGNRGLKIIDISNPASPVLKGEYYYNSGAEAYDVQVVGKYAYVVFGLTGLEIIDISNPSSPTLAGSYDPRTTYYGMSVTNTATSVEVVNNYAYLTVRAARDLGGLWILDVSQFTGTNQPPSVGLAVSPASVTENGTSNLVYTFTRSGATTNTLTANYTVGGTATLGTDYTGISSLGTTKTVTFAAGSSTAIVTVDPTGDTTVESDETVALTLAAGTGYTIGTTSAVTGTITNDDTASQPSITLAVSPSSVTENGTGNLVYTFTRSGATTSALTANYTVGGTATLGTDYTGISSSGTTKTVSFAAGSATAIVRVDPSSDTTGESDETVSLALTAGTGYTVGTTSAVTGTILNDDFIGSSSNDTLMGTAGNDYINGGAGQDTLTGSGGSDIFVFQFRQSRVSAADRITDFAIGTDKIDLLTGSGLAMNAPSTFTRAANSTGTTLANMVNSVFRDANGSLTGNQALGINSAALVSTRTSGIAGTYLVINDGVAGFQSANDLLVNITGYRGALPALGNISVSGWFVP